MTLEILIKMCTGVQVIDYIDIPYGMKTLRFAYK